MVTDSSATDTRRLMPLKHTFSDGTGDFIVCNDGKVTSEYIRVIKGLVRYMSTNGSFFQQGILEHIFTEKM